MEKNIQMAGNALAGLVLTSENSGAILGEGSHRVTIHSVSPQMPKGDKFADKTPQIAVVFKDEHGKQFTEYYNIVGYKRFADLAPQDVQSGLFAAKDGYAVNIQTGMRLVDDDRRKSALSIINKLGHDTGIPAKQSFAPEDLVGRKVIITVKESGEGTYQRLSVSGTRPLSAVTTEAEV